MTWFIQNSSGTTGTFTKWNMTEKNLPSNFQFSATLIEWHSNTIKRRSLLPARLTTHSLAILPWSLNGLTRNCVIWMDAVLKRRKKIDQSSIVPTALTHYIPCFKSTDWIFVLHAFCLYYLNVNACFLSVVNLYRFLKKKKHPIDIALIFDLSIKSNINLDIYKIHTVNGEPQNMGH